MKKTLLFLAIIFSVSLMAQQNSPDGIVTGKVKKQIQSSAKSQTPIWSEDFGNGFPSEEDAQIKIALLPYLKNLFLMPFLSNAYSP